MALASVITVGLVVVVVCSTGYPGAPAPGTSTRAVLLASADLVSPFCSHVLCVSVWQATLVPQALPLRVCYPPYHHALDVITRRRCVVGGPWLLSVAWVFCCSCLIMAAYPGAPGAPPAGTILVQQCMCVWMVWGGGFPWHCRSRYWAFCIFFALCTG